jgi:hypothetical protein
MRLLIFTKGERGGADLLSRQAQQA